MYVSKAKINYYYYYYYWKQITHSFTQKDFFPSVSTGKVEYTEVDAFLHRDGFPVIFYWSIRTESNNTITLSKNHLIYVRKDSRETSSHCKLFFQYLENVLFYKYI